MATLRDAINTARNEPTSERSAQLMAGIHAGKFDDIAQKEGLDLTKFKAAAQQSLPASPTTAPAAPTPAVAPKGGGLMGAGIDLLKAGTNAFIDHSKDVGEQNRVADEEYLAKRKAAIPKFGESLKNEMYPNGYSPGMEFNARGADERGIVPRAVENAGTGLKEGVKKIYGAGQDLGYAVSGVDENGKQLDAGERGVKFGKSLISTAGGAAEGVFAIPGAALNEVPGVHQGLEWVGGHLKDIGKSASEQFKQRLMENGVELNAEQTQAIDEGFDNLSQLLPFEALKGVTKGMPESMKSDVSVLKDKALQTAENVGAKVLDKAKTVPGQVVGTVKQAAAEKAANAGAKIITSVNKIDPTKVVEFEKMTGKQPGEWLQERGIIDNRKSTIAKLVEHYQKSRSTVDNGLSKIDGKFYDPHAEIILKDQMKYFEDTADAKNLKITAQRLKQLQDNGGLTMAELNATKRLYESTQKMGYAKDQNSVGITRATNLDSGLRNFQLEQAKARGFDNLAELNKETQGARFLADQIYKKMNKQAANDVLGLTDKLLFYGGSMNPHAWAALGLKKLFLGETGKSTLAKALSPKATKGIPEVNMDAITRSNEARMLPAPKEGAIKAQVNTPINMPEKTQTAVENAQNAKLRPQVQRQQFVRNATDTFNRPLLPERAGKSVINLPAESESGFKKRATSQGGVDQSQSPNSPANPAIKPKTINTPKRNIIEGKVGKSNNIPKTGNESISNYQAILKDIENKYRKYLPQGVSDKIVSNNAMKLFERLSDGGEKLSQLLHPDNKITIKIFEELTGHKLGKDVTRGEIKTNPGSLLKDIVKNKKSVDGSSLSPKAKDILDSTVTSFSRMSDKSQAVALQKLERMVNNNKLSVDENLALNAFLKKVKSKNGIKNSLHRLPEPVKVAGLTDKQNAELPF